MQKEIIYTNQAPEPVGPYSQAVRVGDFLFCSGQIPIKPENNEIVRGSVSEQAQQALKNVKNFLESQNLELSNVVKTMVFLTDMSKFSEFNEVYSEFFNASKPARSCVAVKELPKGVDVEVEVIAAYNLQS